MRRLLLLAILFVPSLAFAQSWSGIFSTPAGQAGSRAIDWTKAGLPATLPDNETTAYPWTPPVRTQCVTAACNTLSSGTVSTASINAALASAPVGSYVLIPAGSFTLTGNGNCTSVADSCVNMYTKSGVTLRGSGAQATKILLTGSARFQWGPGYNGLSCTWTSGYAIGTTSITVTGCNTTPVVGQVIGLSQCDSGYSGSGCTGSSSDNGGLYVCGEDTACVYSGQPGSGPFRHQYQYVYITSVSGSGTFTLGITPGLYMPNWASGQSPTVLAPYQGGVPDVYGVGLEDLTVDSSGSWTPLGGTNAAVEFQNTYASWIKGVRIIGNVNPGLAATAFEIRGTKNCLVLNNYVFPFGLSLGVPITMTLQGGDSDDLDINNIFAGGIGWEGTGAAEGNVFAYNYITNGDVEIEDNGFFEHVAGSAFQLYEANDVGNIEEDATHGTHDLNTFFRNYISGWDAPAVLPNQRGLLLDTFSRFENAVGNSIGTGGVLTTYQVTTGVYQYEFNFSGNVGGGGSGVNDPLVLSSSMRWGNCDIVNAACRFVNTEVPTSLSGNAAPFVNTIPATHNLPCSFFLSNYTATSCTPKPSGGTGLNWWKVCKTWTTFPTACSTSQTQTFPIAGPDITGGAFVNGTAVHNPAAIAFANLPIDTSYQNSYSIASSSWSAGTETLTFNSGVLPSGIHTIGGFQISGGACATAGAGTPTGAEVLMTTPALPSGTQVKYALGANPGSCAGGTMLFPDVREFDERVYQNDPGGSAVPALLQVGDDLDWAPAYYDGGRAISAGQTYRSYLPNAAGAGNMLTLMIAADDPATAPTITDDHSNSWQLAGSCNDAAHNDTLYIFYALNVAANTQVITTTVNSATNRTTFPAIAEWANVLQSGTVVDGTACAFNSSSTTVATTAIAPSQAGDLAIQFAWNDVVSNSTGAGIGIHYTHGIPTANITWTNFIQPAAWSFGAQWGVNSSVTAVTPSFTISTGGFVTIAALFKASAAPTTQQPSGIRVVARKQVPNNNSGVLGRNPVTSYLACPAGTTLLHAGYAGPPDDMTAVSDTLNGSWTSNHAQNCDVGNNTCVHSYSKRTATVSDAFQASMSFISPSLDSVQFYCITGAAASPYDKSVVNSGNQGTAGPLTLFSPGTVPMVPAISGELVIINGSLALNTSSGLSSPAGASFDGCFWSFEDLNIGGCAANNIWGHAYIPTTASQTFTSTFVSGSTAVSSWASEADAYKPAPTGGSGPTLSLPSIIPPAATWQTYDNTKNTNTNYGGPVLYIDGGTGGPPYTCTVASGSTPPGLSLMPQGFIPLNNQPPVGATATAGRDHASYCILGDNTLNVATNEPTISGDYTFTINVTDSLGNSTISPPITFEVMSVESWNTYTTYFQTDPVVWAGFYWKDKGQAANINHPPDTSPTFWTQLGPTSGAATMPTISQWENIATTTLVSVAINSGGTTATFTRTAAFDPIRFAQGQFFDVDQIVAGTGCSALYDTLFQVTTYSANSITSTIPVPGVTNPGSPAANLTATGCRLQAGVVGVVGSNTPDKEIIAWNTDLPATSYVCMEGGNTNSCTPEADLSGVLQHVVTFSASNLNPIIPGFPPSGLRAGGQNYTAFPFSRGVSSGPKTYLTTYYPQGGIPISTGNPTTTGAVQLNMYGRGSTKVLQGYSYYQDFFPGQFAGITGTQSVYFQVTGIPTNMAVYWPDNQDWGTGLSRYSVTTSNDTIRIGNVPSNATIASEQFELVPTGSMTLGNNTLTVSAIMDDNVANNGAVVAGVSAAITGTSPNQVVTFTGTFTPSQWPVGMYFRTGVASGAGPCTTNASLYNAILLKVTGSTTTTVTAHVDPLSTIGTGSPSATGCSLFTMTKVASYTWPLQVTTSSFVAGNPASFPALPTNTLSTWQSEMISVGGYPCTVASIQHTAQLNQWQVTCTTPVLFYPNQPVTFNGTLVNACFLNPGANPCGTGVAGANRAFAPANISGNTFTFITSATTCPGCPSTYPATAEPNTATVYGSWLLNLWENYIGTAPVQAICAEMTGNAIWRSGNGQECESYYDGPYGFVQIKAYDRANHVTSDFNLTDANSIWNIGIFNSYAQDFNGVSQIQNGAAITQPAIWGPGHSYYYNDVVATWGNADQSANANLSYKGTPVTPTLNSAGAFTEWVNSGQGAAMVANAAAYASNDSMRECSFSLVNKRLAFDAGNISVTVSNDNLLKQIATLAAGCTSHADQIVNTPGTNTVLYYMTGLETRSLVEYYEDAKVQTALVNAGYLPSTACTTLAGGMLTQCDARVPDAVQQMADYVWSHGWIPWLGVNGTVAYWGFYLNNGFDVMSNGDTSTSQVRGYQTLSMILAPVYAWLYLHTGQTKYAIEGDTIWSSGASVDPNAAMTFAGKEYGQQYMWSFDYPLWRTPPSVTTVAPTMSVSGLFATATSTSDGAIICWNTTGGPSTNGLGTDCKNGVPMINGGSSATGTGGQTIFAVAGSASHLDSTVVSRALSATSVTLSPSLLAFGNQIVNTQSAASTTTLTNNGTTTVNVTGISSTAPFSRNGGSCPATFPFTLAIPPATGFSCTIGVTFQPTLAQPYNGTLSVADNAAGTPQTVSLTGQGVAAATATLTPPSVDFGNQIVGTTSPVNITATFRNTGSAVINVTGVTVTGAFSRSGGTCVGATFSVPVGGSCIIGLTFSPNAKSPPTFTGTLAINSNAQGSPQSINLTGQGVQATIVWSSTQGGASYNFGSVAVGTPTNSGPLTLQNTGNGPLAINVTISNPTQYSIASTTCLSSLPALSSCQYIVKFTPTAANTFTAVLTETDSLATNSPAVLSITGAGFIPSVQPIAPFPPIILLSQRRNK